MLQAYAFALQLCTNLVFGSSGVALVEPNRVAAERSKWRISQPLKTEHIQQPFA